MCAEHLYRRDSHHRMQCIRSLFSFPVFASESPWRGWNSPHSAYTAWTEVATAHIEAAKVHVNVATVHAFSVAAHTSPATANTEAAHFHTATVTAHTTPGTIKPSFGPTATVHEKMAKRFLSSCFGIRVIFFTFSLFLSRGNFLRNWLNHVLFVFLRLCVFLFSVLRS